MENISAVGDISDQRPKNTALWHLYLVFWKQLDSHFLRFRPTVELASFSQDTVKHLLRK
jgi:hypothetical protein